VRILETVCDATMLNFCAYGIQQLLQTFRFGLGAEGAGLYELLPQELAPSLRPYRDSKLIITSKWGPQRR
jgi:hypothetical protein